MSVNNVVNKWLRGFVWHLLHPPPPPPSYEGAAYDSSSVTSKSCGFACQHAELRSSLCHPPNPPIPPPYLEQFQGQKPGSRHSPPQPPFKRLNLGIANAYLENTVSRSQIIADGLRLRVDACRFHKSTEANTVKSPRRHRKKKKKHHALPKNS